MRASTVTLTDSLPRWAVAAVLVATLALEVVDIWRGWPSAAVTPTEIAYQDCWALCAWSQTPVVSWEPTRCVCGARP